MPVNVRTSSVTHVSPSLLWAVRIAILAGPVLLCAVLILWAQAMGKELSAQACAPPSAWLHAPRHIAGLFLAMIASIPACPFILWKLAGPDRGPALALAKSAGWYGLLSSGAIFGFLLIALIPKEAEWGILLAWILRGLIDLVGINFVPRLPVSGVLVVIGLLLLSQLLLVVFASRAGAAANLGSTIRAAGCVALFLILFHVGMTLMNEPVPRDPHIDRVKKVLKEIQGSEFAYSNKFQQGYSPTLAALGPPPSGTPPSPEAAGLIDKDLARGESEGYRFRYGSLRWSHGKQEFMVTAHPAQNCQGPCFCSAVLDYGGRAYEIPDPRAYFGAVEANPDPTEGRKRDPARLVVVTFPGAQVYLDDTFQGHAGADGRLEIGNLQATWHNVLVILPGNMYFEQQQIMMPGNKVTTVQATEGEPIRP